MDKQTRLYIKWLNCVLLAFYYLLSPGSQKHETKHLYYVEVSPIEILTEL